MVIKNGEVSYLSLSLQYTVEKESQTFAQVEASDKDRVSFEINGDILTGFTASELQGKNILLSFQPASSADQEIYDRYSSIFDIPAYAVYMKLLYRNIRIVFYMLCFLYESTVWGGTSGQSYCYTSDEVMKMVGTDATKLYERLQFGKGQYP